MVEILILTDLEVYKVTSTLYTVTPLPVKSKKEKKPTPKSHPNP